VGDGPPALLVLIDRGTASAAEALAGALQQAARGAACGHPQCRKGHHPHGRPARAGPHLAARDGRGVAAGRNPDYGAGADAGGASGMALSTACVVRRTLQNAPLS
jgi:Peptidase family S41